jgi:hypothetical protein
LSFEFASGHGETTEVQGCADGQLGRINKTDRNDVRGIAQMMRAGLYRPVHLN